MRKRGTVVRIVSRGRAKYGFVRADDEGFDRFFHGRALSPTESKGDSRVTIDDLEVGDLVTFAPLETDSGHRAQHVKLFAKGR